MRISISIALGCVSLCVVGCNNVPARVAPPSVDAVLAGQLAVEAYDKDGDGFLSEDELQDCPALLGSFGSLDKDNSQSLSGEEIESRIREWQESKAGLVACRMRIMQGGRPLSGVQVLLEPLEFLGPGVLPASGITARHGYAQLSVAKEHLPAPTIQAMNWGFYNVKVIDGDGKRADSRDQGQGELHGVEVTAIGKNETVINLKS